MRGGGEGKDEYWGGDGRMRRGSHDHDSGPPQAEESNVPGDRELARSSPAFMVVNWIVRREG